MLDDDKDDDDDVHGTDNAVDGAKSSTKVLTPDARAEGGAGDGMSSSTEARVAVSIKEAENAYLHLAATGSFKDGIIPEIAPRWEWVRWDM